MNYAILRVAKRSLGQAAAMARHALREMPTPNADAAKLCENTIVGPRSAADVVHSLRARTEPFVKRKDAVRVVELFVGASPEVMARMSRKRQDSYFADALDWAVAKFGGDRANIVFAAVHRDETTPHMQVLLTPVVKSKLAANQVLGGPAGLSRLQDEFASKVGAKYGLRRGEKGSRAKHTSIRQFYGAIQAAGAADAIPSRVAVPDAPRPLTLFANAVAKQAHAKVIAERQAAIEANQARERRIIELARVGLAVHGQARRRLPVELSELQQLSAEAKVAREVVAQARRELVAKQAAQGQQVAHEALERAQVAAARLEAKQVARKYQEPIVRAHVRSHVSQPPRRKPRP